MAKYFFSGLANIMKYVNACYAGIHQSYYHFPALSYDPNSYVCTKTNNKINQKYPRVELAFIKGNFLACFPPTTCEKPTTIPGNKFTPALKKFRPSDMYTKATKEIRGNYLRKSGSFLHQAIFKIIERHFILNLNKNLMLSIIFSSRIVVILVKIVNFLRRKYFKNHNIGPQHGHRDAQLRRRLPCRLSCRIHVFRCPC
jgi:hypothetical protein